VAKPRQLAHIARPAVLVDGSQGVVAEAQALAPLLGGEALGEGMGQQHRIALAIERKGGMLMTISARR
jgi:hypothetical protein